MLACSDIKSERAPFWHYAAIKIGYTLEFLVDAEQQCQGAKLLAKQVFSAEFSEVIRPRSQALHLICFDNNVNSSTTNQKQYKELIDFDFRASRSVARYRGTQSTNQWWRQTATPTLLCNMFHQLVFPSPSIELYNQVDFSHGAAMEAHEKAWSMLVDVRSGI
ncbi:hypothetical protein E4U52_006914 [Claviceps spartinae]|nr:hypothetical protein E4U52_006914 [Claviceps spartinae]